jgi:hypothetical protein
MATTKSPNEMFSMDDFDELLAALSPDDLDKVNDLIDPEVCRIVDLLVFFLIKKFFLEFIFTSK